MLHRRVLAVLLVFLVALAVIVSLSRNRAHRPAAAIRTESGYQFGAVAVDTIARTIEFPARVLRDQGPVLTLLWLNGYPWLRDSAALESPARLLELQQGLALLDWAFWDSLWRRLEPGRAPKLELNGRPAREYLLSDSLEPGLASLVFLGSPEFDPLVLGGSDAGQCATCPAFEPERAVVLKALRQSPGITRLNLKPLSLPPPGTEATVRILMPGR